MAKPKYRIVYEDPDHPEQPSHTVVPAEEWLDQAMSGRAATYLGFVGASR